MAEGAGLPVAGDVDADRLAQRVVERRRHVARAAELQRAADEASVKATWAEEAAAGLLSKAADYEASAERTWQEAEAEHDAVAEALTSWASGLDPRPETAAWRAGLPRSVADLAAPRSKAPAPRRTGP